MSMPCLCVRGSSAGVVGWVLESVGVVAGRGMGLWESLDDWCWWWGRQGRGYSAATTLLPWEITFGSRGVGCAELGGGRGSFSAAADAGWARS